MEEVQAISNIVAEITTIGVLLLWLRAERGDKLELWKIIERLASSRLKPTTKPDIEDD